MQKSKLLTDYTSGATGLMKRRQHGDRPNRTFRACPDCGAYADVDLLRRRGQCTACRTKARIKQERSDDHLLSRRLNFEQIRRVEALRKTKGREVARKIAGLKASAEDAADLAKLDGMTVDMMVRMTGCSRYYAQVMLGEVDPHKVPGEPGRPWRKATGVKP